MWNQKKKERIKEKLLEKEIRFVITGGGGGGGALRKGDRKVQHPVRSKYSGCQCSLVTLVSTAVWCAKRQRPESCHHKEDYVPSCLPSYLYEMMDVN